MSIQKSEIISRIDNPQESRNKIKKKNSRLVESPRKRNTNILQIYLADNNVNWVD